MKKSMRIKTPGLELELSQIGLCAIVLLLLACASPLWLPSLCTCPLNQLLDAITEENVKSIIDQSDPGSSVPSAASQRRSRYELARACRGARTATDVLTRDGINTSEEGNTSLREAQPENWFFLISNNAITAAIKPSTLVAKSMIDVSAIDNRI